MSEETLWNETDLWNESDLWGSGTEETPLDPSVPMVGDPAGEFVQAVMSASFQPEEGTMSNEFITGDSRSKYAQLQINSQPFTIPSNSVVTAQIVNSSKTKVLSASVFTATGTRLGEDWGTSLVVLKFRREDTASIKISSSKGLTAFVEVQVTIDPEGDAEDYTFYIPIVLVRGNLA